MKKMILSAALFGMVAAMATASFAADSIDPAGNASVAINAPSAPVVKVAASNQAVLDSNGYTVVSMAEGAAATTNAAAAADTRTSCLDSYCMVRL